MRERGGKAELGACGPQTGSLQGTQVVQVGDANSSCSFEEAVEDVDGRASIVEGPVCDAGLNPQILRNGPELVVWDLPAEQLP
jgi:hypothetical protein